MDMSKKKILITGAAGEIGRILRVGLKSRYNLRLLYHNTIPPTEPGEDVATGSITDMEQMKTATRGIHTVVHMAANPWDDATFSEILEPNIIGAYTVYEASRQSGVKRVIFASSNHVTGYYELAGVHTNPDMPIRPDGYYGVSKVFGEALARYYQDAYGLASICLRIGTFRSEMHVQRRDNDRILSTWLSPRDGVQLVQRSIDAETVRYGIYYGISNNTRAYWDIENARTELGYDPVDNAEDYA
jgi:dTDP-4-dehydrorhamnose reductase